jgi:hypothetical protein
MRNHSPPYATHSPPHATHSPPYATHSPPYATHSPPYATHSPPHATHSPPYATHSPPYAKRSPPYATHSPPYATHSPPYATHSPPYATTHNVTVTRAGWLLLCARKAACTSNFRPHTLKASYTEGLIHLRPHKERFGQVGLRHVLATAHSLFSLPLIRAGWRLLFASKAACTSSFRPHALVAYGLIH